MKRIRRVVIKNWIPLTIGFCLTAVAVKSAYEWRGYAAVGSEWLVLPFTVFAFDRGKKFLRNALPVLVDAIREERRCKGR